MATQGKPGIHQKALSINLDGGVFGSFAEIGAGQEVARWFLRVGGASATVAKTISAYDKEVSDHLYGAGTRYVSKPRLEAMLETEWRQLLEQLGPTRGHNTRFFSFVDTISARNFAGTNESHGWVGLRFLQEPGGSPSQVVLHVNLRDPSNVQQQEAVGTLGVNLLYAACHALESIQTFLASVTDELGVERIEIDSLDLQGPAFAGWDRQEAHAFLVCGGYADAVIFPADRKLAPPTEVLHKRALVMAPRVLGHTEHLHADKMRETLANLPEEEVQASEGKLGLFCVSVVPLLEMEKRASVEEIVQQVEALQGLGYGVLVSRAPELYAVTDYVNRYTKSRIHFAVGLSGLALVLARGYKHLPGSLLEAMARMFTQNVRVTVYPMEVADVRQRAESWGLNGWTWKEINGLIYPNDLHPAPPLDSLYRYLVASQLILPAELAPGRSEAASADALQK